MSDSPPDLKALAEAVAALLRTRPEDLRPEVPLARYGLDSMAMVELVLTLEERFGCRLEVETLPEAPTLLDLLEAVHHTNQSLAHPPSPVDPFTQLLEDAVLPPATPPDRLLKKSQGDRDYRGRLAQDEPATTIERSRAASPAGRASRPQESRSSPGLFQQPPAPRYPPPFRLLLTGATGFLGSFLVARLLQEPKIELLCLVRCAGAAAGRERILAALARYGLNQILQPSDHERLLVLPANLALPSLGLSADDHAQAATADAICHLGAAVNWVAPYPALRATNVIATRELLALATAGDRARPFHFLSSLAVAYSTLGPPTFGEDDDPLPHLAGLHFGYAQSKAVADALVRQAAARGLPTTTCRAALITGESAGGLSNGEDFLALFLGGCLRLGAAPDLEWQLDAVPVDFAVEVLARRILGAPEPPVLHLCHPQPRGFREAILWLNLYGYEIELLPYPAWLARLEAALENDFEQPLQKLRGFFAAKIGELYLPELFTEKRRKKAATAGTQHWLQQNQLTCPPLDTHFLEKLSDRLVEAGHWPPPAQREGGHWPPLELGEILARCLPAAESLEAVAQGSRHSILTELTSWSSRRPYGLFRYRLHRRDAPPRELLVKVKSSDREMVAVACRVARLADRRLGEKYARWAADLGFGQGHHRELALLRQQDPRFLRHSPQIHGVIDDDATGTWLAICEYLDNVELLDSADELAGWTRAHLAAAIDGLAELQAIHWGREDELRRESWLGKVLRKADMVAMAPLWQQLEAFCRDQFAAWAGPGLRRRQNQLIDSLADWWPQLEALPQTLIHHDFNPRNLCFRRDPEGPRLVVWDWELATLKAPQRDLAELLVFVLSAGTSAGELEGWVERHRRRLEKETGQPLDAQDWRRGFDLSLADLMICRLPMYALVDHFRPQRFLPRVIATWQRLDQLAATQ